MKVTTWNVNGIRARLTHIIDFLREHEPDVLCLQETKVIDDLFPVEVIEDAGYDVTYTGQKGYNGVAILAAHEIEDVVMGMPDDPPDAVSVKIIGPNLHDFACPSSRRSPRRPPWTPAAPRRRSSSTRSTDKPTASTTLSPLLRG